MLPPSGRKPSVVVPVFVVRTPVREKTSITSAPSIGSPVSALNTPTRRCR
jgi:hypothetical protein